MVTHLVVELGLDPGCGSAWALSPAARCLLMSEARVAGPSPVQCFHQHRHSGTSAVHSREAVSSSPFSSREDSDCTLGRRGGELQWPFLPAEPAHKLQNRERKAAVRPLRHQEFHPRLLFVFVFLGAERPE